MGLESGLKAASSVLQAAGSKLEPVTRGRSNAEVWRSEARGSILARMRVPTRSPKGSAERNRRAHEALKPRPLRAVSMA